MPAILRQLETRLSCDGNSEPCSQSGARWRTKATFTQLRLQRFLISCEFSQPPLSQHRSSISSFRPGSRYADSGTNLPTRTVYPLAILKMFAGLVCAASVREWDSDFLKCALSVIAASKGFALIAESLQELDDDTAELLLKGR